MHMNKGNEGFTLIELLVVMGIIGILAGLLFTNFSGARERARDTKRKNDLSQVKNALRLYYNDTQGYPTATSGKITGCGSTCTWGVSTFSTGATVYMNQLPQDPAYDTATSQGNVYTYASADTEHFTIKAVLENASDPAISTSQTRCGIAGGGAQDYYVCAD